MMHLEDLHAMALAINNEWELLKILKKQYTNDKEFYEMVDVCYHLVVGSLPCE